MLRIRVNLLSKILRPTRCLYRGLSEINEEDAFGKGSKFVELDSGSKKSKQFQPVNNLSNIRKAKEFDLNKSKTLDEKNDPDKFGTLTNEFKTISFKASVSSSKPISDSIDYDEVKYEENEKKYEKVLNHVRLSNDPESRPHTDNYYAHRMKSFANEGKISDAISVFYDEMIERDRYKPTLWLYKVFVKILARAGYTHMAFAVFKKLTDSQEDDWTSGYKSSYLQKICTLLFLACSNCKWKEFSIKKTDSIRFYLKNRDIVPNTKMYSAMILSYGKSGAIYEAFNVVDEMLLNNIQPDVDIFSNLLCACIADKKYGFKYALNVWQLCLRAKIKPNLTMYNLLLRATKDCNIGIDLPKRLNDIPKPKALKTKEELNENKVITTSDRQSEDEMNNSLEIATSSTDTNVLEIKPDQVHVVDNLEVIGKSINKQMDNLEWWQDVKTNINRVDLLEELAEYRPELSSIVAQLKHKSILTHTQQSLMENFEKLEEDSPVSRFESIGGLANFFRSIKFHNVEPDFKSFNMVLELIPNNLESEELVLKLIKHYNTKPDIDFINILMKRRIFRREYESFNKAFEMIQLNQLSPNIQTFGVLAYNVKNLTNLKSFLMDLENNGFELNPIIVSTLFTNGFSRQNHSYLVYLLNYVKSNGIKLNDFNLNRMESFLKDLKEKIIEFEKNGAKDEIEESKFEKFRNFYNRFKPFYTEWSSSDVPREEKLHPYKKFARSNDKLYHSFIKRTEKLEQIN